MVVIVCLCVWAAEAAGGFLPRISHDCNPALGTADVEVICKAWLILKLPRKGTSSVVEREVCPTNDLNTWPTLRPCSTNGGYN